MNASVRTMGATRAKVNGMRATLAVLALPLLLAGCDNVLTDFKQQPSVGTWQQFTPDSMGGETRPFRANPQGSVPTTGAVLMPWQVSYTPGLATVDSMSGLENPVAVDERSLENGRKHFQINCAVCHGVAGDANSTIKQVNVVMGSLVPSLRAASAVGRSDGYIWGMIRNGRGSMPSFNRIPEMERWDVVNYIRGLQGRYPVETGPVGFPGETGATLPGLSLVGPTRPSAFVKPSAEGMTPKAEGAGGTGHPEGHE